MATSEVRGKYLLTKGGYGMGANEEHYVSLAGNNLAIEKDAEGNVESITLDKSGYSQTVKPAQMKPSPEEFMTRLMSALGIAGQAGGRTRRGRKTQ